MPFTTREFLGQSYLVDHFNPIAIPLGTWLGHPLGIRWYGLAYLAGLVWGWWLLARWVRQQRCPLSLGQIQDFVLTVGLSMIIGGRLGYCLFYGFDDLVANPLGHWHRAYDTVTGYFLPDGASAPPGHEIEYRYEFPYLLQLWNGGMASHGGILGLACGCWLFCRRNRTDFLVLGDMISAAGQAGQMAFGRFANFINGELWGRESHLPWAMFFPGSSGTGEPYVPRHPYALYAILLEGLIPLAIALPIHRRHRRPGLSTGVVLTCYAIGRFIGEFFREPDRGEAGSQGHGFILGFMTKGQTLTVPVFIIGIGLMLWSRSRPPRPELYVPPMPLAPPSGSDAVPPQEPVPPPPADGQPPADQAARVR